MGKKKEEPKYELVNKTEIRKNKKLLAYATEYVMPLPMVGPNYEASKKVLRALQAIEDKKKEASAAKNDLEAYIYWVKYEGIQDNDAMKEFRTEEDDTALRAVLTQVDEWMEEGEGSY